MSYSEENEIKIADYFDGKLSPAQEESFMEELSHNEKLREQFEDELLMRGLLTVEENELINYEDILQPGQKNIAGSPAVHLEERKKQASLKPFFGNFRNIAAAILVFISITIVFVLIVTKRKSENTALKSIPENTVPKIDSGVNNLNPGAPEKGILAENVFKNYYRTYSGNKDPVEISNYYRAYQKGEYAKVISAKDADYQTMGVNDRNALLKQYMYLYKGLAYLERNEPGNAIQQFNFILQSAGKTTIQYYEAQWYIMLAWLKKNEITKARESADLITKTSSPYQNKAVQVLQELKPGK